MCPSDGQRLKRCKAMAKRSKAYDRIMSDWKHPRPHIFLDDNWWCFALGYECLSEDLEAEKFCEKLNNAAPKRGLKA